MGEFADDYIENYLDQFDAGLDDMYVECRYCGLPGLHWEKNDKNRWKLVDIHGETHSCLRYSDHAAQLHDTLKFPGPKK